MSRRGIVFCVLTVGLALVLAAPARAQTFDKLTYLTFSGPVQIPGVTLTAGTYRFRLTDTTTSRNVIQVLNHDGSAVYSMFHTRPDFRVTVTDDPMVTFKETPAGVAPAIRSLFYGGESHGYEFVWWKPVDMTVANVRQPDVYYTPIPSAVAPKLEAAPAASESTPAPAEPAVAEPAVAEPAPAEPVAEPAEELPASGSALPLVALLGFGALAAGLGVRQLRRRLG